MVSMAARLKFFDAMITSVVCLAAGHRKIYTNDIRNLDVHCRKLLRRVVGPPADTDWNQPWHTIYHAWHRRIDQQLEYHGFKMWSAKYLSEYWKFENYIALLDENRWVKRILHWNPGGGRPGRSFFQWETLIHTFAAGITWPTGWTLPETPISGSCTTPTSCPLPSDDLHFHVLYIQCFCVLLPVT